MVWIVFDDNGEAVESALQGQYMAWLNAEYSTGKEKEELKARGYTVRKMTVVT